jgi:hypothetical protein
MIEFNDGVRVDEQVLGLRYTCPEAECLDTIE